MRRQDPTRGPSEVEGANLDFITWQDAHEINIHRNCDSNIYVSPAVHSRHHTSVSLLLT